MIKILVTLFFELKLKVWGAPSTTRVVNTRRVKHVEANSSSKN